ncbi:MAG: hypothetical protein EXQ52_03090 [Bryobacterales bacterium]|nr:hypothetical protein [Bryobacterales bacterium]
MTRETVSREQVITEAVLEAVGLQPWKEFLSRHLELIVATDFYTVEVWTGRDLQRFMVLFFIELSTRKVEIAGIAQGANGLWMSQIARNLTDAEVRSNAEDAWAAC